MIRDWQAVADAIDQRLRELDMSQLELIQQSGVAPMTVRELHKNSAQRRRSPRTLAALSTALGLPDSYLLDVSKGERPTRHLREQQDPVLIAVEEIRGELRSIRSRLEELERQVGDDAPR